MDEHEQGEQSYVPKARVLAVVFARARIRLSGVAVHALAVRELQNNVFLTRDKSAPNKVVDIKILCDYKI